MSEVNNLLVPASEMERIINSIVKVNGTIISVVPKSFAFLSYPPNIWDRKHFIVTEYSIFYTGKLVT